MNTQSNNGYLLIFRGTDWHKGLSPEQTQKVANDWMAWFKRLKEQGKVADGSPLESSGKIVSGKNGRIVADGPFAESKEAIGGFFFATVKTIEEAVAISKDCPGLAYGAQVEVRPVMAQCPLAGEHVQEAQLAEATA
jgi:hypothetical protein